MGWFRRNSGCSAEQKTLGIPFRTVTQRRKMLRILYHGTKIEANSRDSVLHHSAEEKTTWNFVPWNKIEEFRPKHFFFEKMLSILFAGAGFFVTLIFVVPFPSVPSLGIDSSGNLGMPRNFLPRNNETIPSLFRGIFSEQNSIANPISQH
jgi:hypothetical protein